MNESGSGANIGRRSIKSDRFRASKKFKDLLTRLKRTFKYDLAWLWSCQYACPAEAGFDEDDTIKLARLGYAASTMLMAYEKLRDDLKKEVMKASRLDESAVMTAYVLLGGDAAAVASLLDISEEQVSSLASAGKWAELLARQRLTREKALNRALNFATAHKLRTLLNAFIDGLAALRKDELLDMLLDAELPSKVKRRLTFRDLAALAKTLATVQELTYAALGDKTGRPAAAEAGGADDYHAAKAAALAGLFLSKTPAANAEKAEVCVDSPADLAEKDEEEAEAVIEKDGDEGEDEFDEDFEGDFEDRLESYSKGASEAEKKADSLKPPKKAFSITPPIPVEESALPPEVT